MTFVASAQDRIIRAGVLTRFQDLLSSSSPLMQQLSVRSMSTFSSDSEQLLLAKSHVTLFFFLCRAYYRGDDKNGCNAKAHCPLVLNWRASGILQLKDSCRHCPRKWYFIFISLLGLLITFSFKIPNWTISAIYKESLKCCDFSQIKSTQFMSRGWYVFIILQKMVCFVLIFFFFWPKHPIANSLSWKQEDDSFNEWSRKNYGVLPLTKSECAASSFVCTWSLCFWW